MRSMAAAWLVTVSIIDVAASIFLVLMGMVFASLWSGWSDDPGDYVLFFAPAVAAVTATMCAIVATACVLNRSSRGPKVVRRACLIATAAIVLIGGTDVLVGAILDGIEGAYDVLLLVKLEAIVVSMALLHAAPAMMVARVSPWGNPDR